MFKSSDAPRWRPRPAWLPLGAVLGLGSGAAVGAVVMSTSGVVSTGGLTGAVGSVLLGAMLGGGFGLVVGSLVGTAMVFLVGAHLSRERARGRALVLGAVLPPTALALVTLPAGGGLATVPELLELVVSPISLAAALLGAPLAAWGAGRELRAPDLREIHR